MGGSSLSRQITESAFVFIIAEGGCDPTHYENIMNILVGDNPPTGWWWTTGTIWWALLTHWRRRRGLKPPSKGFLLRRSFESWRTSVWEPLWKGYYYMLYNFWRRLNRLLRSHSFPLAFPFTKRRTTNVLSIINLEFMLLIWTTVWQNKYL